MITSPLGVIMGYVLCAALQDNPGWKWSFYIQSMLMAPSFLGLILIPYKYYDVSLFAKKQEQALLDSESQTILPALDDSLADSKLNNNRRKSMAVS